MALPVLVLRPEPGASATVRAARAMGLDAHACPLFAVRPLPWEPVPREQVDALLLGSANALRHAGAALSLYREMPAYAVGAKTAEAARAAGLEVVETGSGGLQQILRALRPEHRTLLRLAGRERVALDVPEGIAVTTRQVYASEPLPLPPDLATYLAEPALVLLHSGEAATRFAGLCDNAGIDRGRLLLATIGPRVSARAGTGWGTLRSADQPNDAALLALAAQMCEEASSGSQLPEQG
ncbi:uroporphyrinogen-III synthase [Novosphingobium mangrovi (ex Huang et al. 2023)]|uniref:Uroporphyrinogen-III synthase n=1 Tax=Novosphingobium mangrovi (ex Huang et al. 2023) TaxID=2976432 RepID=A0ABT2I017_9SPHN|nr:uroporphyrinogen-III synthase [Novosphingobium mangrovi (ex Huang et al. 2023)]MCT2398135.1 uroporphyrinogen-III synthase [Novosphingobium mangrovi (ex Huang et al. 2023)]